MNRKAWTIGLSVATLSVLCIIVLAVFQPFPETTPTEPNNVNNLTKDYIYIKDLTEYHNYIAAAEGLPDDFVTAEMLSVFGEFRLFYTDPYDLSGYMYCLYTTDGHEITLRASHKASALHLNENSDYKALPVSTLGTNMLQLKTDDKGIFTRDGIKYTYVPGGILISVEWIANNIKFTLSVDDSLRDYATLEKDSLLYRILSVSESEFASALTQMNAIPTKNDHLTE